MCRKAGRKIEKQRTVIAIKVDIPFRLLLSLKLGLEVWYGYTIVQMVKYSPIFLMISGLFLMLAMLWSTKLQLGKIETSIVLSVMLLSGMTLLSSVILFLNKWKHFGLSPGDWILGAVGFLALLISAGLLYMLRDVFSSRGI